MVSTAAQCHIGCAQPLDFNVSDGENVGLQLVFVGEHRPKSVPAVFRVPPARHNTAPTCFGVVATVGRDEGQDLVLCDV